MRRKVKLDTVDTVLNECVLVELALDRDSFIRVDHGRMYFRVRVVTHPGAHSSSYNVNFRDHNGDLGGINYKDLNDVMSLFKHVFVDHMTS